MPQLLTYYSSHRTSSSDTQDLYLGTREMKPLLSIINRLQINLEKKNRLDLKVRVDEIEDSILYSQRLTLLNELIDVLEEDVVKNLKK